METYTSFKLACPNRAPALFFGVLSFICHGFFLGMRVNSVKPTVFGQSEPIEVVAADEFDRQQGLRVVQSERAKNDEKPLMTRFLSNKDQKVSVELRAKSNGAFANATQRASESGKLQGESSVHALNANDAPGANDARRDVKELSIKDLLPSAVAGFRTAVTDDGLEGIPLGEVTALNTRATRYFGFYERVKGQLRIHWLRDVRSVSVQSATKRKLSRAKKWETRVVAHLEANGKVLEVRISRSSGIAALDHVAVSAFKKVAHFPNVPSGMVDGDGIVRLHWDFILNAADTRPSLATNELGRESWSARMD